MNPAANYFAAGFRSYHPPIADTPSARNWEDFPLMNARKVRRPVNARASLSVSEVALRNGVSESFAYDEVKAGRLKATKLGGRGPLRITFEDEAAWIRGVSGEGEAAA